MESLNKFHYVSSVILIAVVMTVTQTAAGTTIVGLDNMQVTPTPTPTPTPPIPYSEDIPTATTPTLQPDINTLFKTLMTQELSSVDRVVLTTELERLLDELVSGQSQISVEYDDGGEESETGIGTETKKSLTITLSPMGVTAPIEEEEPIEEERIEEEPEEDNGGDDDGGDDDGGDD